MLFHLLQKYLTMWKGNGAEGLFHYSFGLSASDSASIRRLGFLTVSTKDFITYKDYHLENSGHEDISEFIDTKISMAVQLE